MASRIADIAPNAMSPMQSSVAQRLTKGPRGRIPTPYKVWLHSPHLAGYMEQLGTFLTHDSSLSTREVEIAVLVVARHWGSAFVLHNHAREAREAGIADECVTAILEGRAPAWDSARDRAIYTMVRAADAGKDVSDEDFSFAVEQLGRAGVADLLALVGYFTSVSLAMKLHAVPIPTATP